MKKIILALSIIFILLMVIFALIPKIKSDNSTNSGFKNDSTAREEILKKSFSAWDGSHKTLVEFVKSNMNDPESFEHVKTNYWDNGRDTIIIKMTYRGKNGFGGVLTKIVRAEADISGNLIKVDNQ